MPEPHSITRKDRQVIPATELAGRLKVSAVTSIVCSTISVWVFGGPLSAGLPPISCPPGAEK